MHFIALILIASSTFAAEPQGKTANGCSYQVINGQYLYDCNSSHAAAPTATPPVSYSAVPVVNHPAAPVATTPAPQAQILPVTISAPQSVGSPRTLHEESTESRDTKLLNQTYLGLLLGSTTFSTSGTESSTVGAGLVLGTNVDEQLGFELGYSYASTGLNLGLANRSNTNIVSGNDSSLNAHLLSAEIQFHLTETSRRLRPYAGLGLAWKHSSLSDSELTGSALSQNSYGPTAAIGVKLRINENLQGALIFRYFLPIASSQAELSTSTAYGSQGTARLSTADDAFTHSGLHQLVGGLQYLF